MKLSSKYKLNLFNSSLEIFTNIQWQQYSVRNQIRMQCYCKGLKHIHSLKIFHTELLLDNIIMYPLKGKTLSISKTMNDINTNPSKFF